MYKNILDEIKIGKDVRQNLSSLRAELKEAEAGDIKSIDTGLIMNQLDSDDAKTRKNAALLLGDMVRISGDIDSDGVIRERLIAAYKSENTLFVKPSYIKALSATDMSDRIDFIRTELETLDSTTHDEADLKHIRELKKELKELQPETKTSMHKFNGFHKAYQVLLTADGPFREALLERMEGPSKIISIGDRGSFKSYNRLMDIRLFDECLLLVPIRKGSQITLHDGSKTLLSSGLIPMVKDLYQGDGPVRFRIRTISGDEAAHQTNQLKRLCAELEEGSSGALINDTEAPEIEIRLIKKKDETYSPYIKLLIPGDDRFNYRKNTEGSSMSTHMAAGICGLASRYMAANAQIIDPFAGTGTLLIERCKAVAAREIYALDTYGKAVIGGRANAEAAGIKINYINRDFFDFKHDYKFDEIITEFPDLYGSERAEKDKFYQRFMEQALNITTENATLIITCGEDAILKKQLRMHSEFHLEREFAIKTNQLLYIIKRKDRV